MYMKGTVLQQQARALLDKEMKKLIIEPEAQKRLVPRFPVGCKRILPSGFPFLRVSTPTIATSLVSNADSPRL